MKNEVTRARLSLIVSMCVFGTIGIARRFLPVPSGFLAMFRGLFGALFLLLIMRLRGMRLSREAARKNLVWLCLSGVLMGVNWILLFESFRYTTVAVATLCYYMAPVFTMLASPLLLKERLTLKKLVCVAISLLGMFFVSGASSASGGSGTDPMRGVLIALAAAVIYASIVLLNKKLPGVPAFDRTIFQLGTAGVVLLPYVLLTEDLSEISFTPSVILLLLLVGLVHTGWAYTLYFSTVDTLSAHTLALLSFLDPVVAVLLSALLLREALSVPQVCGAILILGAAAVAELPERRSAS